MCLVSVDLSNKLVFYSSGCAKFVWLYLWTGMKQMKKTNDRRGFFFFSRL